MGALRHAHRRTLLAAALTGALVSTTFVTTAAVAVGEGDQTAATWVPETSLTSTDQGDGTYSVPLLNSDVPDISVARVPAAENDEGRDIYYMISTTMHLSPGAPIMKSYDLVNWETVNYVFGRLGTDDSTSLRNGGNSYGQGQWASSLRYHDGKFYVVFNTNNLGGAYIYATDDVEDGAWTGTKLGRGLHDPSLFFDDDGSAYIFYGAGVTNAVKLNSDLTAITAEYSNIFTKSDFPAESYVTSTYEGMQVYKIGDYYYIVTITWPTGGNRQVVLFRSRDLLGRYTSDGGVQTYEVRSALASDGFAQGSLVDIATDGGGLTWWGMFFRDTYPLGRIPALIPAVWEDGWPTFGDNGDVSRGDYFDKPITLTDAQAALERTRSVVASDDFDNDAELTAYADEDWDITPSTVDPSLLGVNLVDNGGFESGETSPWTSQYGATVAVQSAEAASGTYALAVTGRKLNGSGPVQVLNGELQKGVTYDISAKFKYTEGPDETTFILGSSTNSVVTRMTTAAVAKGDWVTVSGSYTVPETADPSNIRLVVETPWKASYAEGELVSYYLDDVSIVGRQSTNEVADADEVAYNGSNLDAAWEWNHNPDNRYWSLTDRAGWLRLTTGKVVTGDYTYSKLSTKDELTYFEEARNTLSQRTFGPKASAETRLDVTGMKDGDVAGIATYARSFAYAAVKQVDGVRKLGIVQRLQPFSATIDQDAVETFVAGSTVDLANATDVRIKADADFASTSNQLWVQFSYSLDGGAWRTLGSKAGPLVMDWSLSHFMGYRFGLFNYATESTGGYVDFDYYLLSDTLTADGATLDTGALDAAVAHAATLDSADYPPQAWADMQAALAKAKAVTSPSTQNQIDAPTQALSRELAELAVLVDDGTTTEPSPEPTFEPTPDPEPAEGELIVNGTFADGTTGWTARNAKLTTVDDVSKSSKVGSVTARTNTQGGAWQNVTGKLQAGATYRVSAKVKYSTGPATRAFNITGNFGGWAFDDFVSATLTKGQWGTISGEFTVPTTQSVAEAWLLIETTWVASPGADDLMDYLVDDFSLVLKTPAPEVEDAGVWNAIAKQVGNSNPLVNHKFGADPYAIVHDGRVYVYMTNDTQQYDPDNLASNNYSNIKTLTVISSADLVNWTDHGDIKVAGASGAATWANNSWAPAVTSKVVDGKEKFFLYFANNAASVGVLVADSPTGPWTDPLGHALITPSTPGASADGNWLFDPAVVVTDDGDAYLYFGGGTGKNANNPKTTRVIKLGDDMISTVGTAQVIDAPKMFEASHVFERDGKYYYSYSTNFTAADASTPATYPATGVIAYLMADTPLGSLQEDGSYAWTADDYAGVVLPNMYGFFGVGGNNHQSFFELDGRYYIVYHAGTLDKAIHGSGNTLGYRSTQINEVSFNADGTMQVVQADYAGVSQLASLDAFASTVEAETIGWEKGVTTKEIDVASTTGAATNLALTDVDAGDWVALAGVDLGDGASSVTASLRALRAGTTIEVRQDAVDGTLLGTIDAGAVSATWSQVTANLVGASGVHDLFFVAAGGTGDLVEVDTWSFSQQHVATSTSLAVSGDLVPGEKQTLTATVAPATAAGSVTFLAGGEVLGTVAVAGGSASLTTALAAGSHVLEAQFVPSSDAWLGSSGNATVTVASQATSTRVAVSGRLVVGQKQTLTATVAPAAAAGTVTFRDGSKVLGKATVRNGSATLTVALSAGTHALQAQFVPSGQRWLGSTGAASVKVAKSASRTTARLSKSVVSYGSVAKVAVTVVGTDSPATGKVRISSGGKVLKTATLTTSGKTGRVTVRLPSSLAVGSRTLKVEYLGTAKVAVSSTSVRLSVVRATPKVKLTSSSWTVEKGSRPKVTVTVSNPSGGGTKATGTVRLVVGSKVLKAKLKNGKAVFTLPRTSSSTVLVATYRGDSRYAASSATHRLTVR